MGQTIDDQARQWFDDRLEELIAQLPGDIAMRLEEIPVIVDDEPPESLIIELGHKPGRIELCGLHSGVSLTRRSVHHTSRLPDQIRLFRGPIVRVAQGRDSAVVRQMHITLLHEIGHHFGLDEDQLTQLGYGGDARG